MRRLAGVRFGKVWRLFGEEQRVGRKSMEDGVWEGFESLEQVYEQLWCSVHRVNVSGLVRLGCFGDGWRRRAPHDELRVLRGNEKFDLGTFPQACTSGRNEDHVCIWQVVA